MRRTALPSDLSFDHEIHLELQNHIHKITFLSKMKAVKNLKLNYPLLKEPMILLAERLYR